MARFLLHHRHAPDECGAPYASFKGGTSPLRHHAALASCGGSGHAMWWTVEAADETEALGLLPYFLVARTTVTKGGRSRDPVIVADDQPSRT
jgi:hypothetical protein